jgi:hypothetical protein
VTHWPYGTASEVHGMTDKVGMELPFVVCPCLHLSLCATHFLGRQCICTWAPRRILSCWVSYGNSWSPRLRKRFAPSPLSSLLPCPGGRQCSSWRGPYVLGPLTPTTCAVRGGVFGGRKGYIQCVSRVLTMITHATLQDGYMGTEENIVAIAYKRWPQLFHGFDNDSGGEHGDNCAAFSANLDMVKQLKKAGTWG